MTARNRPSFLEVKNDAAPDTLEDLWRDLRPVRKHEFLRAPQQEVIDKYAELDAEPDVALELATGTGKTAVALLIAEWRRRRSGNPVTYLTLTNQLAGQVLNEASNLGISCADLRGSRQTRNPAEEGRYKTAGAVGITTYANLFNVNPVVVESDLLVLDDVHGGEEFVANMWTVRIESDTDLYQEALAALRPALSPRQQRSLEQGGPEKAPELVHLPGAQGCIPQLTSVLDRASEPSVRFPWGTVRDRIKSCLIFVSRESVTIRPVAPPTYAHPQFALSAQRLYLSATLGDLGDLDDLRRAYGVSALTPLRSSQKQTGRRFIFSPSTYASDEATDSVVAAVWNRLSPKRALLITPSAHLADATFSRISRRATIPLTCMRAAEVSDSLDPFVNAEGVILSVPSRYDGIDLPHESCRLLLLAGSPSAVGDLEQHLRDRWKAGPVLRARERVRFVQGLGRCTRSDTDYAVVLLLGKRLSDLTARSSFTRSLPSHIRAELAWGTEQSRMISDNETSFVEMVDGLLSDSAYRAAADPRIVDRQGQQHPDVAEASASDAKIVGAELRHARHIWEGHYRGAYEAARGVADLLGTKAMSGYRAWWWYLASVAAELAGEIANAQDCRNRSIACGVNQGFIQDLADIGTAPTPVAEPGIAG